MFRCFLPCFCLYLHVYVFFAMLVLRYTHLCAFFMFAFRSTCLDAMPSAFIAFMYLAFSSFLCLAFG